MMRASWLVIVGVAAYGPGKAPSAVKEPGPPVKAAAGGAGIAARPLRYDGPFELVDAEKTRGAARGRPRPTSSRSSTC